jgi:hypothetical protein
MLTTALATALEAMLAAGMNQHDATRSICLLDGRDDELTSSKIDGWYRSDFTVIPVPGNPRARNG